MDRTSIVNTGFNLFIWFRQGQSSYAGFIVGTAAYILAIFFLAKEYLGFEAAKYLVGLGLLLYVCVLTWSGKFDMRKGTVPRSTALNPYTWDVATPKEKTIIYLLMQIGLIHRIDGSVAQTERQIALKTAIEDARALLARGL